MNKVIDSIITVGALTVATVCAGYLMTVGQEMYYTIHGEPVIELDVLDYSPTNNDVSAEVQHGYNHNIISYSPSILHPDDEDGHS